MIQQSRTAMCKIFSVFIFVCVPIIIGHKKEDKLLLNPVEIIDLVMKEQHKMRTPMIQKGFSTGEASYGDEEESDELADEPELDEDEKTLKNRKMWSRWSKWGGCSVTCGCGVIRRHRDCVAGRCAPGEREEQHRPCSRAPCLTSGFNFTDEMRETE